MKRYNFFIFNFYIVAAALLLTSCSDFFDQESDNVVYSGEEHLTNWPDTVYSVMGILNKMQVIADRTILLGEVRGDLVSPTSYADADLREMAMFSMDDDNQYNQPRDYYAVINNCNYYLAKADTTLKSNRNQYIFMKEYAAVKAIRAWTYLQLVLNYGSVPFYTEPILTKEESEKDYPRYDLAQICQYFLADLSDLSSRYDNEYPWYGDNVRNNDSRLFFFPLNIVRGDLNLWLGSTMGKDAGQQYFRQAAICYYKYINERNGENSYYAVSQAYRFWFPGNTSWTTPMALNFSTLFSDESYAKQAELITIIPGDSIRAEGYYSELRNIFNTREENDYKASVTPSQRLIEISESQDHCCLTSNAMDFTYSPEGLPDHTSGDLRLSYFWNEGYSYNLTTGDRIETQQINKYRTRNVRIYRRQMVYLRFAEALNLAGQPLMAYKVLERGLSNKVLRQEVYPYISQSDSAWVKENFNFDESLYQVIEAEMFRPVNGTITIDGRYNTMGIHTRGSGWTPYNDRYYPEAFDINIWEMQPDSSYVFSETLYEQAKKIQQEKVDSLILNEDVLELAFEGTRYYDLMRFAMRQDNPGEFMNKHINARNGEGTYLGIDLSNPRNWYLRWGNGKIGY